MTNNTSTTEVCNYCSKRYEVSKPESIMYDVHMNGCCSYDCESRWYEDCLDYEKRYRP